MLQENYRGISILNSSGGVTCTVQIVDKKTKMIIYPRHNSESGFTRGLPICDIYSLYNLEPN